MRLVFIWPYFAILLCGYYRELIRMNFIYWLDEAESYNRWQSEEVQLKKDIKCQWNIGSYVEKKRTLVKRFTLTTSLANPIRNPLLRMEKKFVTITDISYQLTVISVISYEI